ncbi:MAG: hypothetical protein MK085_13700 [Phycisphaerales bacterium]|nr:hypothetical protein [Phycisphaerales bacterium]
MSDPLSESLRWALQFGNDPAVSAADWLARELAPETTSASNAILVPASEPTADLDRLKLLKKAFKTLRLSGETSDDRRAGARYYAAVQAAAIVRHGVRISRQRIERVQQALQEFKDDDVLPDGIRALVSEALERLDSELIPETGR